MRRNIIRLSLVVLLIIFGVYLYHVGKEHKIYVDNKDITIGDTSYTASGTYRVWVDGEEIGDVRIGKRKVAKTPGAKHTIVIQEVVGKELSDTKVEKSFKLKVNEGAIIQIPALLQSADQWYEVSTDM